MSESVGQAVFLSYASQDAPVATRLSEALRAAGVEVWLDQEGGLVGGDAWDRKIREQITTCALFVPLISANTQARKEGYFRLEWHLAEERARLIAKGVPFIVPVSVDGTTERGALVPDAFLAVQWTRLPGGEAPAAFVARVKKLLTPAEVAQALPPVSAPKSDPGSKARATAAVSHSNFGEPLPPSPHSVPLARPRAGRERRWQLTTAVLFVVAAGMAFLHFRQPPPPPPQTFRYTVSGPPHTSGLPSFAISPDGKSLVTVAIVNGKQQLWLRALDGLEIKPLPSTEDAGGPFWSPDGRSIAFFTLDKLKKVAVTGGPAQTVCDAPGSAARGGGSWSRDNVIIFADGTTGQIQRVAAVGGVPVAVTKTEATRRFPVFLPDGRRFLWVNSRGPVRERGVFLASLDDKEERRIVEGDISRVCFAPGERGNHLLFRRETTLTALPFDLASAQATGEAFPVAENVREIAPASVSDTGVLVCATTSEELSQISWFDRSGQLLGPVTDSGSVGHPALSPDEKRVIFRRGELRRGDLWIRDLNRGNETRLTSGAQGNAFPQWSPDGDRVVFGSDRDGSTNLYQRAANGSGQDERLLPTAIQHTPSQWSRDGQFIVYSQRDSPETLWVLPLKAAATERKPVLFLNAEQNSMFGQISPDGRWMAFTSNRSGPREVYVRPFPSGEGEWPVSVRGGQAPRWRADGKEMFFVAPDGKMMAVPVNAKTGAKPTFEAGVPVALFATSMLSTGEGLRPQYQYDVTADGSRFLIAHRVNSAAPTVPTLTVVTNWLAGLEK
jgi:Tol biopolymer transport system component